MITLRVSSARWYRSPGSDTPKGTILAPQRREIRGMSDYIPYALFLIAPGRREEMPVMKRG